MADLGNLVLKLSADPAALEAGLLRAEQRMSRFGGMAVGLMNQAIGEGLFSAARTALTTGIDEIGHLLGKIPVIGAALEGLAGGLSSTVDAGFEFLSFLRESWRGMKELKELAIETGSTVEGMSFLMGVAGSRADAMVAAMRRLSRSIYELGYQGAEANQAFMRLRLTAEDLAGKSTDLQFIQIAKRLAEIKDHTERSYLAFQLMGKGAAQVLPIIEKVGTNEAALRDQLSKRGLIVTDADVEMAEKANKALDMMDGLFKGLKRQTAVGFAPIAVGLSNELGKSKIDIADWGDTVITIAEFTGGAFAFWIDIFKNIGAAILTLGRLIEGAFGAALAATAKALKIAGEATPDRLGGGKMRETAAALESASRDIMANAKEGAEDAFKQFGFKGGAMDGVMNFFRGVRVEVRKTRQEMKDAAKDAAGMLPAGLLERIGKMKIDLRSPTEKFRTELAELDQMRETMAKKGIFDPDLFDRAYAKIGDELQRSLPRRDTNPVAASARGSAEALNAITTATKAAQKRDPAEELLAMQKAEQTQRMQMAQFVRELRNKFINQPQPQPANIP